MANTKHSDFSAKKAENTAEETAISTERSGKKSSKIVDVVLVVLIVLVIGFGFTLLGRESSEAATSSGPLNSDFLTNVIGEDSPDSPPSANFPHIVHEDGVYYFRGIVSSEASIAATIAELEALFGEGNVVAEVVIDENFVEDPNAPTSVYFSENVLFESGSATVASQFTEILASTATFLEISASTTIEISGHTDSNGAHVDNLALSQARVEAARLVMVNAGGDPDRITAAGFGEAVPIADNATAEGRQLNRRVELVISTGASS